MGVSTEAWGGWFEQDGVRSSISKFTLLITSGDTLSGSGTDDLGHWTWAGESNGAQQVLRKQYVGGNPHNQIVTYTGTRTVADGKELIQGTWNLAGESGPFSLEKLPVARQENYTGYYTQDGVKHDITSAVLFTTSDNNLYGSGVDDVGEFTWTGEINPTTNAVTLHKQYLNQTSTIDYVGTKSDQAGNPIIYGTWGSNDGDFYLGVVTGPWTGWFEQGGQRSSINGASLDLTGSSLTGFGTDDIGAFTWEGENLNEGQVVLRKKYVGSDDTIVYTGTRSFQDGKEVIEGTWDTGADSGPFHIEIPAAPPAEKPLVGVTVSIRSTVNPNAFLRIGGDGAGDVNLQVGRFSYERFELVPLEVVGEEQVYAIRSALFKLYLHLDPTVSPEQAPTPGTTFHPKGVGFTLPVKEVDAQSKFTVVVNNADGLSSFSFKLLNPGTAFKQIFLRLDTNKLATEKTGSGGGEVNGQTYIGPLESLLIEPFP